MAKSKRLTTFNTSFTVGAEAPDFTLPDASGQPVALSSFRGRRPVVVVFGSFGCRLFCDVLDHLRRLRDLYQGKVEFLFVYVSEAYHSSRPLRKASRPMPPAGGAAARRERVRWYEEESGSSLHWLLDKEDGRVEGLYAAWPRRLVVVGIDGKVVFDAGPGVKAPWNLSEVEKHLQAALPSPEGLH
jgi:hypothetical protein